MINKSHLFGAMLAMGICCEMARSATAEASVKQPVFLICPSTAKNSALSLYVVVDGKNHHKVLALGIEELTGINSSGTSYDKVLSLQRDPKTRRRPLSELDARDFGRRELVVEKGDVVHI